MMQLENLVGDYSIVGKNQNIEQSSYKGTLNLSLDENKRINAKWIIGNQLQFGNGFFKNAVLVINFWYQGEDSLVYKGVVFYKCLTATILDGFWSEEFGNPKFLGEERCFKIIQNDQIIN